MTARRTCGDCQACCNAIRILDPPSAAGEDCRHQCAAGCGIYETRPSDCRRWSCAWLAGQGEEEVPWGTDAQRPDRLGLVFSGLGTMRAREAWPGASTEAPAKAALAEWLLTASLLLIFRHGNNTELCDDWLPRDDEA